MAKAGTISTQAYGVAGPARRFFFSGLIIVAVVGVVAFEAINRLRDNTALVVHSNEVLTTLASVDAEIAKGSSARRGLILSRDSAFLIVFQTARDHADDLVDHLRELTQDNPDQLRLAEQVASAEAGRFAEMKASLDAFGAGKPLQTELNPHDATARGIRTGLLALVSEEHRILADREWRAERTEIAADLAIGGGFALALALFFMAARRSVLAAIEHQESDRLLSERAIELAVANRQLGELLRSTSDRLEDPLRALQEAVGTIGKIVELPRDPDALRAIRDLPHSTERMSRIVLDLRTYSHLVGYDFMRARVPLEIVVRGVIDELAPRIRESNATVQIAHPLPTVIGDARLLHFIFFNLIANAVSFHLPDEPPQVRIAATTDGARATIAVSDKGIGIERDNHARIFSLFERLDQREPHGSGVGLSIAQRAAELLSTRIRVESEPGAGSTFSFSLPVVKMPS